MDLPFEYGGVKYSMQNNILTVCSRAQQLNSYYELII